MFPAKVSPAPAGMIPAPPLFVNRLASEPRTRGDDPIVDALHADDVT